MKIVLLIAPLTSEGHYQSWLDMISGLLIENGYKVIYYDNSSSSSDTSLLYKLKIYIINNFKKKILLIYTKKIIELIYRKIFFTEVLSSRFNINNLNRYGKSIDFIFFLNLDFLDNNSAHWLQWRKSNSTPWAGISLYDINTPQFQERLYLNDPNLKTVFSLRMDSQNRNSISIMAPPIIYLPEITQHLIAIDEECTKLLANIDNHANGRPIIILCGSIESRKNIQLFLQASQHPHGHNYFFLIAGKISEKNVTNDEKISISKLKQSAGNFLLLDQFFESESKLNSLIDHSSYIFAAYVDFDQSSNMVAKSAALKKPILVTRNSYMANVVKKYGLGYEIDNSPDSLFYAIDSDIQNPIPEITYDHFLAEHNIDKFTEIFLNVLPK